MRLICFAFLFFVSCAGNDVIPEEVLPQQKMGAVMFDFIQADEMADFYSLQDSVYRNFSKRASLYDSILGIHAVSKTGFQKSLQFYQSRPDLLKTILDSLQKKSA
jgi:hypothetical protein